MRRRSLAQADTLCSSVSSLLTVPNDDSGILLRLGVAGLQRTWDQKLSSGLLLTFTFTLLFKFRNAQQFLVWLAGFHPGELGNRDHH